MDKEKEFPGVLSVVKLTSKEREEFLDYINATKPYLKADFLYAIFGDSEFLKFFDVFAGVNIKVPTREEMVKIVNYCKIYSYCKERGFTDTAYEKAAKVFGRRKMSIERVVQKVQRVFNGHPVEDED